MLPREQRQSHYSEKLAAARLANNAMLAIKEEKLRLGITIDPEADPAGSGLIGSVVTPVTSNTGYIQSKLTSTNPNFAAVVVHLLKRAGIKSGDVVAVGVTGSFPALNVSTYAALQVLKVTPIIISSAAASEWGANDINFLWLDMEHLLFEKRLIGFRTVEASRGGVDDRGFGISKQGRTLLDEAIARNGIKKLDVKTLAESIDARMSIYYDQAGDRRIAAYINVGGGSPSVGTHIGKKLFEPGLNTEAPRGAIDSVMLRFVQEGVPVIHLSNVKHLARAYGLPIAPSTPQPLGQGGVFVKVEYNPWLALAGVVVILLTMLALFRFDLGVRLLLSSGRGVRTRAPERAV
jgi:poly-gamma-glutamate system protein